ncbi:MAG: LysR family transcriptional regulator [Deltaproteobacteria bacterium]|nr:LysR family transcriptional regulator [Nannocystaceae bacterium]
MLNQTASGRGELGRVDLNRVDLNLLVLFDVVMQERNVARAAKRLGVSASAVSHGLGRLRAVLHDPLLLKSPKGVVPTARALELAAPIDDILTRVRTVVATGEPFSPMTSTRRFAVGGPDGVTSVMLPRLLVGVRKQAPDVVISMTNQMPTTVLAALDAREIDLAITPSTEVPARFSVRHLYDDDFVIGARIGHPFLAEPTLDHYCASRHVVASITGDPRGHIDQSLAKLGRSRRVALTVPGFLLAMAVVSETDLIVALPMSMIEAHAARFAVASTPTPLELPRSPIHAVVPTVALRDAGLAWLLALVEAHAQTPMSVPTQRRSRRR